MFRSLVPGLILGVLLSACAPVEVPPPGTNGVQIDGLMIRNQLAYAVTEVQILALSIGNFVSCGNILAKTACSTGFPNRYYNQGKLVVSWKERAVPQSSKEFVVEIDETINTGQPAWIEVIIFSPGEAGARFVQK